MNLDEAEPCSVVNGACRRAANMMCSPLARLHPCWKCANPVCVNCSIVIQIPKKGRRRFCHDCIEALDGNDTRVMEHLRRLAGYAEERAGS